MMRKKPQVLMASALVLTLIVGGSLLAIYQEVSEAASPWVIFAPDGNRQYEFGLVLGTSERNFFGGSNPYFDARIVAAADLYRTGVVRRLILSGGAEEVGEMRNRLIAHQVPESVLVLDPRGRSTMDSARNALGLTNHGEILVISQKFHVERAIYLANKVGLKMHGYAAHDPGNPVVMVREWLARVKAVIYQAEG